MRPLLILLVLSSGCGAIRTVPFGEEEGCGSSDCDTGTGTTSTTGGSSTSTGDGTDAGESTTDEGDTSFIPINDHGQVDMCDIWDQYACPEGEKCTAYATMGGWWDAHRCVPIMGDGEEGDPCTAFGPNPGVSGLDTCAKGHVCFDVGVDDTGYCLEYCFGSPNNPTCTNNSLCAIYGSGIGPLCLPSCDPLMKGQDCPNMDNLCISDPGGGGFVCVLDGSGGMGVYGAECQYANSCNQGLFCAAVDRVPGCPGAQGCCTEFCDVDEPNTCAGKDEGQECESWWGEGQAPAGNEHVGACAIPE